MSTPKKRKERVVHAARMWAPRENVGAVNTLFLLLPMKGDAAHYILPADAESVERMGRQLRAAFDSWMCEDETEWDSFGACMLAAIGITAKGGRK